MGHRPAWALLARERVFLLDLSGDAISAQAAKHRGGAGRKLGLGFQGVSIRIE